jgi:hypothetical protein
MPNDLLFNPHHAQFIAQFPTPAAEALLQG